MSEAADWRATAKSLFEDAGDVVVEATASYPGTQSGYNSSTGKMERTPDTATILLLETGSKFHLMDPDMWKTNDMVMLGGTYALTKPIPIGALISWADPKYGTVHTYDLIQVSDADGGVGAAAYFHLRRSGG